MRKLFVFALVMSIPSAFADSVLIGDAKLGEKLHQQDCLACHGTEVYTRKDRKITGAGSLENRVRMCQGAVGKQYKETEIENLVKYLNDTFYKFEK